MPFEDDNVAEEVIDEESMLLARFAGDDANDGHQSGAALTRMFDFRFFTHAISAKTSKQSGGEHTGQLRTFITVEPNDVPLDGVDYTGVGLHSWVSAVFLAQRMCAGPWIVVLWTSVLPLTLT